MSETEQDRVTCPGCGKGYRYQSALAGKEVPCKQCGGAFIVPDQPGLGLTIVVYDQGNDEGLYDLASDPDQERELPPAFVVNKTDTQPLSPPTETQDTNPTPNPTPGTSQEEDDPDDGEPQVHVSEAAKAARREEQRIAAAAMEAQKSWRDYKWLFILIAVVILFLCIWFAMDRFGDFIKDPTQQSLLDQSHAAIL